MPLLPAQMFGEGEDIILQFESGPILIQLRFRNPASDNVGTGINNEQSDALIKAVADAGYAYTVSIAAPGNPVNVYYSRNTLSDNTVMIPYTPPV